MVELDGWEEERIGSPSETVNAIEYLTNAGVKMRDHTLIWPGYTNMPDDNNRASCVRLTSIDYYNR